MEAQNLISLYTQLSGIAEPVHATYSLSQEASIPSRFAK